MKKKKQCQFFNTCGAYIIEEKIRSFNMITGKEFAKKKWSQKYCFSDNPQRCVYFEGRKKLKKQAR